MVGTGPKNANLNGAYKNAETFSYQDELGELVRSVCREMNHGILCFLPSYRMLDTLEKRSVTLKSIECVLRSQF